MPLTTIDFAAITATAACLIALHNYKNRSPLPLPPGPPRWPVVGSLFSMPKSDETFEIFTEWREKYGNVTYAGVLGQHILVLNSREAAVELLEQRSARYSDRPRLVMAGELVGWGPSLAISRYGEGHKRTRKLFHEGLSPKAIEELGYLLEQEAIKLIQRLLETPEDFNRHIRQATGATLLKVIYGYNVKDHHDHFLKLAEEAVDMFSVASTPGLWLVDSIPWLKYLPWAPFKSKAKKWHEMVLNLLNAPMNYTIEQMNKGQNEPSLMARWLERADEQQSKTDEEIYFIKWAGTSIYGGGADTSVSAVLTFFLAMVHNPQIQATAQAEIDRVVGNNRLPTLSDRASLPYLEALYKEVIRWQPVAPLGIPHRFDSDTDDEYRGMRIPKGSLLISNIWGMSKDPNVYHDPTAFKPERFLDTPGREAEMDPENLLFGFGRRRCPGTHLAHASVWLSISVILAVYNITPAIDSEGHPIMPNIKYSQTTISFPESFQCTIKPRSSNAAQLIRDSTVDT